MRASTLPQCPPALPRAYRDDLEQQLASLRAAGRGDSQEVTLLSLAQVSRILR